MCLASTLWGDCSTCQEDRDPEWKCPLTVAAYNDLLGDPGGNEADIIEIQGGIGTLFEPRMPLIVVSAFWIFVRDCT